MVDVVTSTNVVNLSSCLTRLFPNYVTSGLDQVNGVNDAPYYDKPRLPSCQMVVQRIKETK